MAVETLSSVAKGLTSKAAIENANINRGKGYAIFQHLVSRSLGAKTGRGKELLAALNATSNRDTKIKAAVNQFTDLLLENVEATIHEYHRKYGVATAASAVASAILNTKDDTLFSSYASQTQWFALLLIYQRCLNDSIKGNLSRDFGYYFMLEDVDTLERMLRKAADVFIERLISDWGRQGERARERAAAEKAAGKDTPRESNSRRRHGPTRL